MHSAAERQGFNFPLFTATELGSACVGFGQIIGNPSRRATMKNLFRIVGAP